MIGQGQVDSSISQEASRAKKHIEHDLTKIAASALLKVDPEIKINHEVELETVAKELNGARSKAEKIPDLQTLKDKLATCSTFESLCHVLWSHTEVKIYFQEMQNAAYLEELIRIG